MEFFALLDQVVALLQSRGQVSYRALQWNRPLQRA
jgi:hypothetical protein